MLRDTKRWQAFEAAWQRDHASGLAEGLQIFVALLEEAKGLNVWPPENALEGLENDIRLARRLNPCSLGWRRRWMKRTSLTWLSVGQQYCSTANRA